MTDPIDKAFADLVPGTTRARSDKALKRVRNEVPDPQFEDPFDDVDAWDTSPTVRVIDGQERELFTIGALAKAWDNRTVYSVRKLERAGVFPRPVYRKPRPAQKQKGDRLYTREQIEAVVRIAKECEVFSTKTRIRIDKTEFTQRLLAVWRDLA